MTAEKLFELFGNKELLKNYCDENQAFVLFNIKKVTSIGVIKQKKKDSL